MPREQRCDVESSQVDHEVKIDESRSTPGLQKGRGQKDGRGEERDCGGGGGGQKRSEGRGRYVLSQVFQSELSKNRF